MLRTDGVYGARQEHRLHPRRRESGNRGRIRMLQMIGSGGAEVRCQQGATRTAELIGMDAESQFQAASCFKNAGSRCLIEDVRFAEDIAETR